MAHNGKITSTPFRRRQTPADRSHIARLSHGSWRLIPPADQQGGIASAGEFWNRLGL